MTVEDQPRSDGKYGQQYSDEDLLNHIRDLADGGEPPSRTEMNGSDGPRVGTYKRRFGKWSNAVKEAGFEVRESNGREVKYTDSELVEILVQQSDDGVAPSQSEMKESDGPSPSTYENRFGSWCEAIEKAGLEPSGQGYSEEELVEKIREMASDGSPPTSREMNNANGPNVPSFQRVFGSWSEAVEAAGFEPRSGGGAYSEEELLRRMQELSDGDEPPTWREMDEADGPSANTYNSHFGSWANAVEAAGLKPRREWDQYKYSTEELVERIRDLAEDGEPPTIAEMREVDGPSPKTYQNRFGSWSEAIRSAGLDPSPGIE